MMSFKRTVLLGAACIASLSMHAMAQVASVADRIASAETDDQEKAQADDAASTWRTTTSLESWTYATQRNVRGDSVLNPGNQIAKLSHTLGLLDQRFNLRLENDQWQWVFAPRIVSQSSWLSQNSVISNTSANESWREQGSIGVATQAFGRLNTASGSLTAGRELFTWGPAQLRSPSNPFFFDSGRTNPLASPNGVDLVRYTQTLQDWRITAAHVFQTSQVQPLENVGHTQLIKVDYQDSNSLSSLIVAEQAANANTTLNGISASSMGHFAGAFTQITPDDAWLLYGEFGTNTSPYTLQMSNALPWFSTTTPGNTTSTSLLGASYTMESGWVVQAEYLHNSNGWNAAQENQYFANANNVLSFAQTHPAALGLLGLALNGQPRMMGRDFGWAQLSSNPQETKQRWIVNVTQNLTDHSSSWVGYYERNLYARLSVFGAMNVNLGSAQSDFAALSRGSVTAGIKWFVF
jgi:hypothetical protein